MAKNFTVDDIKSGYVVRLRNGDLKVAMRVGNFRKILIDDDGRFEWFSGYNHFLTHKIHKALDIVEVYGLVGDGWEYEAILLDTDHRPLLWKRPDPVKMTVEEINKKLGYEVEIVASR